MATGERGGAVCREVKLVLKRIRLDNVSKKERDQAHSEVRRTCALVRPRAPREGPALRGRVNRLHTAPSPAQACRSALSLVDPSPHEAAPCLCLSLPQK